MDLLHLEQFLRENYLAELHNALNEDKAVVIDYSVFDKFDPVTADQLLEDPYNVLKAFREAAENIVQEKIHMRFRNLPESRNIRIRNLRAAHLNSLWTIDATIKAASEVKPQIYEAVFECPECSKKIPVPQETNILQKPGQCECGRRGDFPLIEKKLYDVRWLQGIEPFEITTGEQPGEIAILLKEDLTTPRMQKKTDPGSRLTITGVLKDLPKRIKGKLSTKMDVYIEANYVEPSEIEFEELEITPEDEKKILELAKDPNVYEKLKMSIAPGLWGFEEIKEAVVLQLFSGIAHRLPDGSRIRGNVHILLTGDPAVGKSVLLKLVTSLVPRGRYVSGSGVTGAGLCTIYDTLIPLETGAIVKIGDFVEMYSCYLKKEREGIWGAEIDGPKVMSLVQDSLKIKPVKITHLWKITSPSKMIKIRTASGKEIVVTENNPMPVLVLAKIQNPNNSSALVLLQEKGTLDWIKAGDLMEGDSIACPKSVVAGSGIFWDEIMQLEEIDGQDFVYDITVEGEHSFVANGLIIHNTASVIKNEVIGSWVLEAGALILCNKGLIGIDEFDKMSRDDQIAMHEAMSVESYHGDTPVTLSNGEIKPIRELVEDIFKENKGKIRKGDDCYFVKLNGPEIFATDFHKIMPKNAIRVSKHIAPEFFYKITLQNGKSLVVTPSHPCFVFNGIKFIEKPAEEISNGEFFPIVRTMPIAGDEQGLDINPAEIFVRKYNAKHIKVPVHNSPQFCKFIGYVISEGSHEINRGKKSGIVFTNSKEALLNDFENTAHMLFGLKPCVQKKPGRTMLRYISAELKNFVEAIEPSLLENSYKKKIPSVIFRCRNDKIALMLRAMFDGDGSVFGRKDSLYVTYTTASETLASQLHELLLRFSVAAYIRSIEPAGRTKQRIYSVTITGSENLRNFVDGIGFSEPRKNEKIKEFLRHKSYRVTYSEKLPGDIALCRIKKVEKIENKSEKWVYDITVPGEVFVSNGMVLHNTVSIAKASIVATLPAQTAVLAGANPQYGRFDPFKSVAEQIQIPETLLSRFDLKFALKDKPDKATDAKLADHIISTRRFPQIAEPIIGRNLLRKYIAYAKHIQDMELTEEAAAALKDFYVDMRNRNVTQETNTVSITLRQYEALIRLAEASAKIRLDTKVRMEDADRAIRLMKYSLTQLGYDYETGTIDIDRIEGGMPASKRKKISLVMEIIDTLQKESKEIALEDIRAEAENRGIEGVDEVVARLLRDGAIFEPRAGFIRKV